jgi:2-iminobutanoate/2-iminopropanoate deaminase
MKLVHTNKAPAAIGPYSQAVVANGMVYTSGQIALTSDGVMVEDNVIVQTKQVLKNLKAVLEEAGSSLNDVVKTTIFISSMDHFGVINGIYESAFGSHKPARSTVAVKTLPKNALVEIDAIAIVR